MPHREDTLESTNYRKVMFVIDKDVYAEMRDICDKDPKRVIKAGDLIRLHWELLKKHVPSKVIEESYEQLRAKQRRFTNKDITSALPKLTAEQRAAIEKILSSEKPKDQR